MPHRSLYILTASIAAVLSTSPARAAIDILHSFSGDTTGGSSPNGPVTLVGSKLYGMTQLGGANSTGTVFSLNTDGTGFTLLRSFASADGVFPQGAVTVSGSKLYGMTNLQGSSSAGTLYSMNTDGTSFGVLRNFTASAADGGYPNGAVTVSGSKLYGMTNGGGSSNNGSIFSINTDGTGFNLLHSFVGGASDGTSPWGSLTLSGSKLFGMTYQGGNNGGGTIFSMNVDGTGFGLLHSFASGAGDGAFPRGSLTLSGDKLYGMTLFGGATGLGDIFSINLDGTGFSELHSFGGGGSDGQYPLGDLTLKGSTLYGMTGQGGASNLGTLFSIDINGSEFNLLESFAGGISDGSAPQYGGLALSDDGSTLYGMTSSGGTTNSGVIFSRTIAPVPEPATAAWGMVGLVGLALRRPRRS